MCKLSFNGVLVFLSGHCAQCSAVQCTEAFLKVVLTWVSVHLLFFPLAIRKPNLVLKMLHFSFAHWVIQLVMGVIWWKCQQSKCENVFQLFWKDNYQLWNNCWKICIKIIHQIGARFKNWILFENFPPFSSNFLHWEIC